MRFRHLLLWCSVLAAPACAGNADSAAPFEVATDEQPPDEEPQGRSLTGDAVDFKEAWVNTFVGPNGTWLGGVRVDRGQLVGQAADSSPRRGLDFVGASFHGQAGDTEALFTIAAMMPVPGDLVRPAVNDANPDDPALGVSTYLYRISVQRRTSDPAHPWGPSTALCAGDKVYAYAAPFRGAWRKDGSRDLTASRFTMSCMTGVVAKCGILWGYKPWVTQKHTDAVDVIDVHQACVRGARADYCARGEPHTEPGTLIKITDELAPQIRFNDQRKVEGRSFEAAWSTVGARCLSHERWLNMPDECHDQTRVPPYMTELPDKTWVQNECNDEVEAQTLSKEKGWNVRVFIQSHMNGMAPPN